MIQRLEFIHYQPKREIQPIAPAARNWGTIPSWRKPISPIESSPFFPRSYGFPTMKTKKNPHAVNPQKKNPQDMAMDQYLYIPFLVGWTSIYQLFWGSPGVPGFWPIAATLPVADCFWQNPCISPQERDAMWWSQLMSLGTIGRVLRRGPGVDRGIRCEKSWLWIPKTSGFIEIEWNYNIVNLFFSWFEGFLRWQIPKSPWLSILHCSTDLDDFGYPCDFGNRHKKGGHCMSLS